MKLRQKKLWMSLVCVLSLVYLAGSASANLVVNGGFETGDNTGFTSDYNYVNFASATGQNYPDSSLWKEKSYAVGTNPALYHSLWGPGFTAHSGTYMMIVNGATSTGEQVWAETNLMPVTQNATYYFSVWIASIYPDSPAELSFSIMGTQLGSPILAGAVGAWKQFYVTWDSGINTYVDLAAINLNTAASGNDFCLDDIVFDRNPVPLPPTALLLGSGLLGLVGMGWRRRKTS
jgi:hypothetical protein